MSNSKFKKGDKVIINPSSEYFGKYFELDRIGTVKHVNDNVNSLLRYTVS